MNSSELKFNKMEYDTSKARKFFEEHSPFSGVNCEYTEEFVHDSAGNKICVSKPIKTVEKKTYDVDTIKKKLWRLSQLIEENVELFCQLEYIIRKIQPAELKAYDLKLIVQNLLYSASVKHQANHGERGASSCVLSMDKNTPLVSLAYAAQFVLTKGQVQIESERETAVVCWLFVDLCKKAGLEEHVCLRYLKMTPTIHTNNLLKIKEFTNGCFAVVTAKSDIDSAVDVLVETPDRFPWGVKRILVQESVLQRFRNALEDKAKRNPGPEVDDALSRRCTGVYRYEGKIFLLGFAGDESELHGREIIVEAYRTVKELVSLLSNFQPFAISVWCDSVAESHEIAHNVTSNIIWINGFGHFDGPPEVSQSFFSLIDVFVNKTFPQVVESESFNKVSNLWSKLSLHERALKLKHLLDLYRVRETDDSFYYVSEKCICAGTEKPAGPLVIDDFNRYSISKLLSFVIKGGSLLFHKGGNLPEDISKLYSTLNEARCPVSLYSISDQECCPESVYNIVYKKKVIWTSYGTIFSN